MGLLSLCFLSELLRLLLGDLLRRRGERLLLLLGDLLLRLGDLLLRLAGDRLFLGDDLFLLGGVGDFTGVFDLDFLSGERFPFSFGEDSFSTDVSLV